MTAETEGFAQFVEMRERALQRTAWLLTGYRALAEDLVQTWAPGRPASLPHIIVTSASSFAYTRGRNQ